jgi:hypothetical protein
MSIATKAEQITKRWEAFKQQATGSTSEYHAFQSAVIEDMIELSRLVTELAKDVDQNKRTANAAIAMAAPPIGR